MIKIILFSVFSILLIIKIIVSEKKLEFLKSIFTPLTTISIILFPIYYLFSVKADLYASLITLALVFSLTGDIFNIKEKEDRSHLQLSMIFFFITHCIYIYIFSRGYSFAFYQLLVAALIIFVMILSYIIFNDKIDSNIMKLSVSIYTIIVSITMFVAIGNLSAGLTTKVIMISVGATLFWLSDLLLGIHSFWKKLKFDTLIIWGLYAPAQLLIAYSCFY